MHVRFDGGEVTAAVARLDAEADAARRLAGSAGGLGGEVADLALAKGLRVLRDVCGDVLEVGGLALDQLAATTRAGATRYGRVETTLVRAIAGGGAGPR